jgi:hypothetical protein
MAEPTPTSDPKKIFLEIGSSGLKQYAGLLTEEFLVDLQGTKAIQKYKEMAANDPIIATILFVIEQMITQVEWRIEPFKDSAGDSLPEDEVSKEFIEQCWQDMSSSWSDTLSEIVTMFTFGWAYSEICYKMRNGMDPGMDELGMPLPKSLYDDRKIGWRKWALRGQETLRRWEIDNTGGIQGMWQASNFPISKEVLIPIDKAILFRTRTERNNPEGASLLRRAYRPWYYTKRFQEIEAIGIERDLAGLPVLRAPAGLDLYNDKDPDMTVLRHKAEALVKSIRRGQQEGVLLPGAADASLANTEFNQWNLTLLSSGSRRQFDLDATITRYETRMAMTVLADFIFLGQGAAGSWALSTDKTQLFIVALGSFLSKITEPINRHEIPRLLELNAMDVTRPPKMAHGDITSPNITEMADYLSKLSAAGASLFPDEALELQLRRIANLPQPSPEALPPDPAIPPKVNPNKPANKSRFPRR